MSHYQIATTLETNEFIFAGPARLSSSTNSTLGYAISQTNVSTAIDTGAENRRRSIVDSVATPPPRLYADTFYGPRT
jgi:hypothetical protein